MKAKDTTTKNAPKIFPELRHHTSSYNMPHDKLYIRINCLTCLGNRMLPNGSFHDPLNPTKWKECPYCDLQGLIIIEASKETVVRYILQLSDADRTFVIRNINDND